MSGEESHSQTGHPTPAGLSVNRAAVLGAGTMGAQIAGLLASNGIACDLLDVPDSPDRDGLATGAIERLPGLRPPALDSPDALHLIRPGNIADDLPRLAQADWVIEAVSEDLAVKSRLWTNMAEHLRPDAIASTNTSGIAIASIALALPAEVRRRFLGAHFFNPPRHMRLLEVIPTPETAPGVTAALSRFCEDALGKVVVTAKDVTGFISNRVGVYALMAAVRAMDKFNLGPDEADSITGTAMGRPRSATFRTLDLVGLDVLVSICDNNAAAADEAWEREAFAVPDYIRKMVELGWTGDKAGQGFYRRLKEDGETKVLVLDPETLQYRERRRLRAESLTAALATDDPASRLEVLLGHEDVAGRFAWRALSRAMAYAAQMVGVVTDDLESIDKVMRWGFAWEIGLFEAWQALGISATAERMRADGLELPQWVERMADARGSFYAS